MRAYSLDLRERVAVACDQPGRTVGAVAAQFSVSVSFVAALLQRQRTRSSLAALPHRSGPAPYLDAHARAQPVACVSQQPDATLAELCVWLTAGGARWGGRCWAWTGDEKKGLRRRTRHRPRKGVAGGLCRSGANRGFYLFRIRGRNAYGAFGPSTNWTYCRCCARAKGGQRAPYPARRTGRLVTTLAPRACKRR